MTSFLFIPAQVGSPTRRVDFGNIGTLFAEAEEPARRGQASRRLLRVAAAALLVVLALGDTMLVTRSAAVCDGPATRIAASPTT